MKRDVKRVDTGRRRFINGAAAAGLGTFAVASLPMSTVAATAQDSGKEDAGKGYRLSQHVLDYYKSTAR